MYERPRQLCLDLLTVRLPKSPQALRQQQLVLLAAGSAFRVVAIGIDDCIPAALNGDVYGDALIRYSLPALSMHSCFNSSDSTSSKLLLELMHAQQHSAQTTIIAFFLTSASGDFAPWLMVAK